MCGCVLFITILLESKQVFCFFFPYFTEKVDVLPQIPVRK